MSYYEENALGALEAGTSFPPGSEFAMGYRVTGLPSAAAPGAVQILRAAVADGFRGMIVAVQWGPAFGVPSGMLAVKIRTGIALTGAQLNSIASSISGYFQSRLRFAGSTGATVTNSHLHQLGASGGAATPDFTSLLSTIGTPAIGTPIPGALPGSIDPATGMPYGTMLPPAENFFTQSVGGIPVWGLLAGGVVAIGAIGYVVMGGKPKTAAAAVKANMRRVRRRRSR